MPFIIAFQLTRRFKSIRHIFKHVFEMTYALRNYGFYYIIYLELPTSDKHTEFYHHLVR